MKQIIYETREIELLNLIALTYGKTFEDSKDLRGRPLETLINPSESPMVSLTSDNFFTSYKENDRRVFPKLLSNWVFLEAMNGLDAYLVHVTKDMNECDTSNMRMNSFFSGMRPSKGFFAAAFKNNKTREIVVVFRGTDDINDWLEANIEIGLFNTHSDQLLEATYFYEYIRDNYNSNLDNKIILTGHSLGGCLAQFTYASNVSDEISCKTFNPLGIGSDLPTVEEMINGALRHGANMMEPALANNIIKLLKEDCVIQNNHVSTSIIYDKEYIRKRVLNAYVRASSQYDGITTVWEKESSIFKNLKFSFGFGKKDKEPRKKTLPLPKDEVIDEIVDILTIHLKFSSYFRMKDVCNDNCISYYFEDDTTPKINTHVGYVVNINKKTVSGLGSDIKTLSKSDLKDLLESKICKHHSIYNFIMYVDGRGYITPGYIRYALTSNVFLSYIYKDIKKLASMSLNDLEIELMTKLNKIRKDKEFFKGFVFGKYYMNCLKCMEPYYKQGENQFVLGVKQNCLFDSIKSSKPYILTAKTNSN